MPSAVAALIIAGASVAGAQTPATFGSLLDELANRDSYANHPDGAYAQHQTSSYDRRDPNFGALGAPWGFANNDWNGFIRSKSINGNTEWVMMEDTGPGVISQIWLTGSDNPSHYDGYKIRVYIDGSTTPVIDKTINELVNRTGNSSGFGNTLSFHTPLVGGNLHAPIPYGTSAMVTWSNAKLDTDLWYHVDYRKYDSGKSITSYRSSDQTTYATQLTNANTTLATAQVTGHIGNRYQSGSQVLNDGDAVTHQLTGPGAIRRLKVNISGADQIAALNHTYVELTFDGQRTAYVPVNQFYGNGDSQNASNLYNEFEDVFRRVESNGDMTAVWVMPYRSNSQVRLVNKSGQIVTATLEVDSGDWAWDANSMHFHANYRAETDIKIRASNGTTNFRYINIRGRGVFVGDTLAVRNRTGSWWGEGDEKIYIDYLDINRDGSTATPDQKGTGTEDYYNYSWGHPADFFSAFVNQPNASAQSYSPGYTINGDGLSVNSRVRGLDTIPFDQSLKFDMEIWAWQGGAVDYGVTTYWYGTPGASALVEAADLAVNFESGSAGQTAQQVGITDTAGDGQWFYLASDQAAPTGATTQDLTWGRVGDAGNDGFGGGQDGANLAAISNGFLFTTGSRNIGIDGSPGYHELAVAPSGSSHAMMRWQAGPSSAGLININGSVRNFIGGGDSIDFAIYVNGVLKFSANGSGATLDETFFDFDATIATGQFVDFVIGNGGSGNFSGDEALLRAIILTRDEPLQPGQPVLSGSSSNIITETGANAMVGLSNSAADVTLFWDTQNHGVGTWPNSNPMGSQPVSPVNGAITGLTADTRYFYRFFAINTTPDPDLVDWSESGRSFVTAFASGQVVTDLAANAVAYNQIDLTWNESFNSESGFAIERSPNGTGSWTRVGTAPANATGYQDSGLDDEATYHYRVIARNEAGDSDPSNSASATTPKAAFVADLGGDWVDANTLPAGWGYFDATAANGGTETALTPSLAVGNGGNTGFGGGHNSFNLGAVTGNGVIFKDGTANGLVAGTDLAVHTGDDDNLPPFGTDYLILRYTISASDILNGTSATITGSFRELISNGGNSITAYVYKNSTQLWAAASANGSTLTQANGTFNLSTTVAVGDAIDFVVYNNGNLNADETAVRGMIALNTGDGGDYASWISNYSVGGFTALTDDADGDGIKNGVENFFGTDPSVFSGGVVAGEVSGSTFTFTHPQNSTPASDISVAYLWSKDLVTFNASGATDGAGTTVTLTTQLDTPAVGTTTVTATVAGSSTSKLFVNVEVNQN
jgi:hypothetical protein